MKREKNPYSLLFTSYLCVVSLFLFSSFPLYTQATNKQTDSLLTQKINRQILQTDLILQTDSLLLEQLPLKGVYKTIYKHDRGIVAEIAHDKVKIARDQQTQGWIQTGQLDFFAPAPLFSQLIWLLEYSSLTLPFFLLLFMTLLTGKLLQRKESSIPILSTTTPFIFLIFIGINSFIIIAWQMIRNFYPHDWKVFYLNPLINPLTTPAPLSFLVAGIWLSVILLLTLIEQAFRYYPAGKALLWIIHLLTITLLFYILFLPAPWYTATLLFIFPGYNLVKSLLTERHYRYRCGKCNGKLRNTGKCPHCGIINT